VVGYFFPGREDILTQYALLSVPGKDADSALVTYFLHGEALERWVPNKAFEVLLYPPMSQSGLAVLEFNNRPYAPKGPVFNL
jgi:hypothetical protein